MRFVLFFAAAAALGVSRPMAAPNLFDEGKPVEFTLTADLKTLYNDRDTLKAAYHPGSLSYVDSSGMAVKVEVRLKTRGIWRRNARNCDAPPLWLDFKGPAIKHTMFAKQTRIKLTTYCRDDDTYEQYVLNEYALYKMYNRLTPLSFRARLARVTYVQQGAPANARPVAVRYGILIEGEDAMMKRNNVQPVTLHGARWDDLEPTGSAVMATFEYMIGNTDWSAYGLHNVKLVRDSTGASTPIAYDFDFSGAVNAHYATADPRVGIKTVRDRAYRGPCLTKEGWVPVVARFDAERHAIDSIAGAIPALKKDRADELRDYIDQFYRSVDDKGVHGPEFIAGCRKYTSTPPSVRAERPVA
ncbi:MAG: hypothetical protein M3081_00280 [Gemmatimonadota bacterium]|nr:hypothetical protein [Gemmatimonadota bacterium]